MSTRLYSDEEMKAMGFGEMSIEDFDSLESDHVFSEEYNQKKESLLSSLSKESQGLMKRRYYRAAVAAVVIFLALPATAYAATKLYSMKMTKDKHLTNIVVTKNDEENVTTAEAEPENKATTEELYDLGNGIKIEGPISRYKLTLNYLPAGCTWLGDNYGTYKYGGGENEEELGLSFWAHPWSDTENMLASVEDTVATKQFSGDNYDCIVVQKSETYAFDKEVFVMYEKEALLLHFYAGYGIDLDETKKIVEGIGIEPTEDMAEMIPVMPLNPEEEDEEDVEIKETVASIGEEDVEIKETVASIGEEIKFIYNDAPCTAKVESVELRDSFEGLEKNLIAADKVEDYVDDKGNLVSYNRTEFVEGDGINEVSSFGATTEVRKKLVYVTLKIENKTKYDLDYCMGNDICFSDQKGSDGYVWKRPNYVIDSKAQLYSEYMEPIYLDTSRSGADDKSYYFMDLKPGENIIHVGYLVDEDWTDCMYLHVNEYRYTSDNKYIKLSK